MNARAHVVILSRAGAGWVGGLHYAVNLVDALIEYRLNSVDADYDISVVTSDAAQLPIFARMARALRTLAVIDDVQDGPSLLNRVRWHLARRFGSALPWLEDAMREMDATFVYPMRSRRVRSAEWIPDFQYRHYPQGSNPREIAERQRDFAAAVEHSRTIVLSSAQAEQDCHALFPESLGRTEVLRFRVSAPGSWLEADPRETVRLYHLPERFLLVSNLLAPTKNHGLVLDALARLEPSQRTHIVFTGDIYDQRNPGFYNGFLEEIHSRGLAPWVSVLGLIPKDRQFQLLRASVAYVQPSLFEGWHTGLEEAHMLGKPVVVSDIPVHREQAPPHALWFDPADGESLARQLSEGIAKLTSGRQSDAEIAALADYGGLRREFAKTFLGIAGFFASS